MRDTLIAGQSAQVLTRQLVDHDRAYPVIVLTHALPSVVTRPVADRVKVLANGQFYPLHDFGAQLGGSWLTPRVVPAGACLAQVVRVMASTTDQPQPTAIGAALGAPIREYALLNSHLLVKYCMIVGCKPD